LGDNEEFFYLIGKKACKNNKTPHFWLPKIRMIISILTIDKELLRYVFSIRIVFFITFAK